MTPVAVRLAGDGDFAGADAGKPDCYRVCELPENIESPTECEILSGSALIYDANGHVKVVRTGDRFVIPAGFSGIWEVVEPCRKVYITFEQP